MVLVDTSAWIEWLTGSRVGAALEPELPDVAEWLVPTIVQLELAKWLTREVGEEQADQVLAYVATCVIVDLDTRIALAAAAVSAQHRLATADAIIYATTLAYDAELLTCDRHFAALARVRHFPKDGG